MGPSQPAAPAATPNEATAARGDVAGSPSPSSSASASESRAPGTGPIKPRPRASRAKKKERGEPKARPRQSKSRAMDKADPTGPAGAEPSAAASERSLQPDSPSSSYQIKLSPGPDTLRRGVNPLGVLDELRELGESTVTTDPRAVPLLDELRSGTLLPELDHHGPDRRRAGAIERCFPLRLRGQQRAHQRTAGRWDSRAGATGFRRSARPASSRQRPISWPQALSPGRDRSRPRRLHPGRRSRQDHPGRPGKHLRPGRRPLQQLQAVKGAAAVHRHRRAPLHLLRHRRQARPAAWPGAAAPPSARYEDRIRCDRDTGLRSLPSAVITFHSLRLFIRSVSHMRGALTLSALVTTERSDPCAAGSLTRAHRSCSPMCSTPRSIR